MTAKSAKLTTPATAGLLKVPESVPPPALKAIAIETVPANPVAVLPKASRAVTCTAGAIALPARALAGCTVKNSPVAAAGATLNALEVAAAGPVADAVSV